MAIDPRRSIVWIGDLEASGARVNVLCAKHADDLVVPVGWERRDIRDTPRLFMVPSNPSSPARPRRTVRRNRPAPAKTPALTAPAPATVVAQSLDAPAASADPGAVGQTGSTPGDRPATSVAATPDPALPNPALAELHRRSTELSAATVALLEVDEGSPLLARAFRAGCAAG